MVRKTSNSQLNNRLLTSSVFLERETIKGGCRRSGLIRYRIRIARTLISYVYRSSNDVDMSLSILSLCQRDARLSISQRGLHQDEI